jgi:hypothetical protein
VLAEQRGILMDIDAAPFVEVVPVRDKRESEAAEPRPVLLWPGCCGDKDLTCFQVEKVSPSDRP